MPTWTLSQIRSLSQQALQHVDAAAVDGIGMANLVEQARPSDQQRRVYLRALEECIDQFDVLLREMEVSGLDAVPEGASLLTSIRGERERMLERMVHNAQG